MRREKKEDEGKRPITPLKYRERRLFLAENELPPVDSSLRRNKSRIQHLRRSSRGGGAPLVSLLLSACQGEGNTPEVPKEVIPSEEVTHTTKGLLGKLPPSFNTGGKRMSSRYAESWGLLLP